MKIGASYQGQCWSIVFVYEIVNILNPKNVSVKHSRQPNKQTILTEMAIPKDKDELIKAIVDNYKKLTTELASIPIDLTDKKELDGHSKNTLMSINNLVAYLVGWGQLVLKWHNKKSKGIEVNFPETGFKWNELGRLAQKFYKDYEKDDFKTLNEKLDKTINEILKLIESKTNGELYEMIWYDKWTMGKMIQLNTSSPFKNAKDRIRKWKKTKQLN